VVHGCSAERQPAVEEALYLREICRGVAPGPPASTKFRARESCDLPAFGWGPSSWSAGAGLATSRLVLDSVVDDVAGDAPESPSRDDAQRSYGKRSRNFAARRLRSSLQHRRSPRRTLLALRRPSIEWDTATIVTSLMAGLGASSNANQT